MVVPVPATLPDNTLAPEEIVQKFSSTSLHGLGDDYYNDETDDYGYVPGGGGSNTENICALMPYMPGCSAGGFGTGGYQPPVYDQNPAGGGARSSGSGSGGTSNNTLILALIKAGVDVSKLAVVTPGTTLNKDGGVSRQNPGFAIPGTYDASVGVSAGGSSSMLLMLGVGAALFFMMNKRQ